MITCKLAILSVYLYKCMYKEYTNYLENVCMCINEKENVYLYHMWAISVHNAPYTDGNMKMPMDLLHL